MYSHIVKLKHKPKLSTSAGLSLSSIPPVLASHWSDRAKTLLWLVNKCSLQPCALENRKLASGRYILCLTKRSELSLLVSCSSSCQSFAWWSSLVIFASYLHNPGNISKVRVWIIKLSMCPSWPSLSSLIPHWLPPVRSGAGFVNKWAESDLVRGQSTWWQTGGQCLPSNQFDLPSVLPLFG